MPLFYSLLLTKKANASIDTACKIGMGNMPEGFSPRSTAAVLPLKNNSSPPWNTLSSLAYKHRAAEPVGEAGCSAELTSCTAWHPATGISFPLGFVSQAKGFLYETHWFLQFWIPHCILASLAFWMKPTYSWLILVLINYFYLGFESHVTHLNGFICYFAVYASGHSWQSYPEKEGL